MSSQIPGYLSTPGGRTGGGGGGTNASGFVSGGAIQVVDPLWITAEAISGGRAVAFTQSGTIQQAMASVSGRMPAVGIVRDNYVSGATVIIYRTGPLFNNPLSGTPWQFSGWLNQPLYVGASGDVIASGVSTASGIVQQILGVSTCNSGMEIQMGDALEQVIAASGDIGSGAVAGQAGGGYFSVASGTLAVNDIASGIAGTAIFAGGMPFTSGMTGGTPFAPVGLAGLVTGEIISGTRAVAISPSGFIWQAMASVSGRMPAVGVSLANVASGLTIPWSTAGFIQLASGMGNFSGFLGQPVWVGRSGQITQLSGSWTSGNYASGDIGQKIGIIVNSGGFVFNTNMTLWSGSPTGEGTGGIL